MGLDMYLSCNDREFVRDLYARKRPYSNEFCDLDAPMGDDGLWDFAPKSGTVCYWRKANHIHKWFVDHVQGGDDDCKRYSVSLNQLSELKDACKTVLDASRLVQVGVRSQLTVREGGAAGEQDVPDLRIEDPTVASKVLPTCEGLFFGDADYEEWYLHSTQFTYNRLSELLGMFEADENGLYSYDLQYRDGWYTDFTYQSSW